MSLQLQNQSSGSPKLVVAELGSRSLPLPLWLPVLKFTPKKVVEPQLWNQPSLQPLLFSWSWVLTVREFRGGFTLLVGFFMGTIKTLATIALQNEGGSLYGQIMGRKADLICYHLIHLGA
jgi:hypothetical protein